MSRPFWSSGFGLLKRCPECRYDLRELAPPNRCPECGFPYDDDTRAWRAPISRGAYLCIVIAVLCFLFFSFGLAWYTWEACQARPGQSFSSRVQQQLEPVGFLAIGLLFLIVGTKWARRRGIAACTPDGIRVRSDAAAVTWTWDTIIRVRLDRHTTSGFGSQSPGVVVETTDVNNSVSGVFSCEPEARDFCELADEYLRRHEVAQGEDATGWELAGHTAMKRESPLLIYLLTVLLVLKVVRLIWFRTLHWLLYLVIGVAMLWLFMSLLRWAVERKRGRKVHGNWADCDVE